MGYLVLNPIRGRSNVACTYWKTSVRLKAWPSVVDCAYKNFFVLAAPRFKGAVQSVVHPFAIRQLTGGKYKPWSAD